jgi:cytochrome c
VKKIILPFALLGVLIACNSNSDTAASNNTDATTTDTAASTTTAAATDYTQDPNYQKGLELEAKSDCATCHKLNEKLVGPAFKDVATRYAGATEATVDTLAGKIISGGAGRWGQIPMTPHPNMSKDDARTLVKYVLLLKDAS